MGEEGSRFGRAVSMCAQLASSSAVGSVRTTGIALAGSRNWWKQHWYQRFLHTNRARHLRRQLLRHGGTRVTIIDLPWYLDERV